MVAGDTATWQCFECDPTPLHAFAPSFAAFQAAETAKELKSQKAKVHRSVATAAASAAAVNVANDDDDDDDGNDNDMIEVEVVLAQAVEMEVVLAAGEKDRKMSKPSTVATEALTAAAIRQEAATKRKPRTHPFIDLTNDDSSISLGDTTDESDPESDVVFRSTAFAVSAGDGPPNRTSKAQRTDTAGAVNAVTVSEGVGAGAAPDAVKPIETKKGTGNRKSLHAMMPASTDTRKLQKEIKFRTKQQQENRTMRASQTSPPPAHGMRLINTAGEHGEIAVPIEATLARHLKAHQFDGVRFLWDCCIFSVKECAGGKSHGRGAVLAHTMGLGKTLQVVAFLHTVINCTQLKLSKAMVLAPTNTLFNWMDEFRKWTDSSTLNVQVVDTAAKLAAREQTVSDWYEHPNGGVLILTYVVFFGYVDHISFKIQSLT